MKYKTTQKAVKNGYKNVIKIGYCELQYLLYDVSPVAYTTRSEGWGADVYDFSNTAIATGYAPFGNITPDYETVRAFEATAADIVNSGNDYDTVKEKLNSLISEFISSVTK